MGRRQALTPTPPPPIFFPLQAEWRARLLLERSAAASCPTAAYHLSGAKKIQQDLAGPGVLERFLPDDPALSADLRACFAGLWPLDAAEDAAAVARVVADALADPEAFVLKPQREGGGNNLYREELASRLREGGPGLAAYVLMQRIRPPINAALMMWEAAVSERETLSELGVFGVFLRKG